eukprot:235531-Rhodomonas_salina.1
MAMLLPDATTIHATQNSLGCPCFKMCVARQVGLRMEQQGGGNYSKEDPTYLWRRCLDISAGHLTLADCQVRVLSVSYQIEGGQHVFGMQLRSAEEPYAALCSCLRGKADNRPPSRQSCAGLRSA